jgi:hypothetical protein
MSVDLHADQVEVRPASATVGETGSGDRGRPNVSGDLPTIFQAAPMFRRAVVGYDRFQVDTYVQWAEDELATAAREREHLVERHLRTRKALEEAQELLSHSAGAGEFLRLSPRIGSMLAAAADEAASIRAEAEADRCAASAQAERLAADAERRLADAAAEAERVVARAAADAAAMAAEAGRIVAEAEETHRRARADAAARLEEVRMVEQRAAEHAGRIRRQAVEDAAAARLQARDEIVRMLGTGREQRRRADAAAAATRERLTRDAAASSAPDRAELAALEHRRATLRAEVDLLAEQVAGATSGPLDVHRRLLSERLRWRARSLRVP